MLDYQHGYPLTKSDEEKLANLITKDEKVSFDAWLEQKLDKSRHTISYSEKKFLLTSSTVATMAKSITALHNRDIISNACLLDISNILENALGVSKTDRTLQLGDTRCYNQQNGICYVRYKINYTSWTEGWIFKDFYVRFDLDTSAVIYEDAGQLATAFLKEELDNLVKSDSFTSAIRRDRLRAQIEKVLEDDSNTRLYNPSLAIKTANICTIL